MGLCYADKVPSGAIALKALLSPLPTPSLSIKPGTAPVLLGRVLLGLTHSAELPVAQPKKASCYKFPSCFPSLSLLLVGFPWHGPFSRREANTKHVAAVLA